jgi:polyisoprenoid-binding protein YceI
MINKISFCILAMSAMIAFSFTNPDLKAPVTFKVDPQKSVVVWTGKKVTGSHTGSIRLASGDIAADGALVKSGNFVMDMTSITCTDLTDPDYNKKLVGHLKNDDFFAVDKFPKATFVITKVAAKSGSDYDVTGKLTIKGITNEITFPAQIVVAGNTLTAKAKITVDRTKFDIKYGSGSFFDNLGDKTIDNDFTLDVELVAVK